jgi:hypothetical protein
MCDTPGYVSYIPCESVIEDRPAYWLTYHITFYKWHEAETKMYLNCVITSPKNYPTPLEQLYRRMNEMDALL